MGGRQNFLAQRFALGWVEFAANKRGDDCVLGKRKLPFAVGVDGWHGRNLPFDPQP